MLAISIVMPLYNKEKEVNRAIRSVFSQTVQDFELIVVNDGSTDRGPDIVRSVEDARIKVIDQANAGVSAARNRGIKEARADLIAFLDADDEWRPDFLQTILELRSKYPSCDAFGTRYFLSSQAGEMNPAVIRGIPPEMRDGILKNYFAIASQSDPPLWTSAVAVTGKAINAVGGFPVGVIAGEDLLTWARLAMKFRIAYSTKPCAIFYNPRKVADRPGRIPQEPDIVGNSLTELFSSVGPGKFPGLRQYIALWHRMRAVIFIQMDDSRHALKELMKAMRLAPSLRLFQLLLIASLPGPFSAKALMLIRRLKAVF